MKKIETLFITFILVLSLVVPVFASAQADADADFQEGISGPGSAVETQDEEVVQGLSDLQNPATPTAGAGIQVQTKPSLVNTAPTDFKDGIVVCGRHTAETDPGKTPQQIAELNIKECNFQGFVAFINRLVNYIIILATLFMVFAIGYTGWEYLTAGEQPATLAKLKERLWSIIIGIVILLGSWILFRTVADTLLTEGYQAYIYLVQ